MKLLKIKIPEIKPFKKIISPEFRKSTSLEEDKIQRICKKLYGYKVYKKCSKYKKIEQLLKKQENINLNSLKNQLLQISIEV
tara:strand:+ start:516 stop:761 length:246 start_codon:yes stop_codon:yes gene_type:complete